MTIAPQNPYLVLGARGQIGRDICRYFSLHGIACAAPPQRIQTPQDADDLLAAYPGHQVVNLSFDKTLADTFTNIDLPLLLDDKARHPTVHLSSNAVYGIAKRTAGTNDALDPFHEYARQKIAAEQGLGNSHVLRGSFLATSHRIFTAPDPRINADSLWNGITTFEFARLLVARAFPLGISTVASDKTVTWHDIATTFAMPYVHDPNLPDNQCVLISDLTEVQSLQSQFETFEPFLGHKDTPPVTPTASA